MRPQAGRTTEREMHLQRRLRLNELCMDVLQFVKVGLLQEVDDCAVAENDLETEERSVETQIAIAQN
jgi:hypothetical protein